MSELDLCCLEPSFALGNGLHICMHWLRVTLLANLDFYIYFDFINHRFGSLIWVKDGPYWVLISYKVGSLFLFSQVLNSFAHSAAGILDLFNISPQL